ncbi:MAG: CcmD family protein [Deltaproteobacteria bacterium]|nr:MAG: CcmD family protein [Deltaproteobacteria bacterium]
MDARGARGVGAGARVAGRLADHASHARRAPRRGGHGAPARDAGARRGGSVTNLPYLFAAYAAVWIGLFAYLLRLERRSRELEEEVRELRRLLER